VFDPIKSTRRAARELGLNPDTCGGWVRKAGLKGLGKPGAGPHPGRDEYFRLGKTGVSRRKAAAAVGIHLRTAEEWDQGIRKPSGRRIYPDGRVVDYKRGVTIMNPSGGTAAGTAPVPLSVLEKPIDRRYLSVHGARAGPGPAGSRTVDQGDRPYPGAIAFYGQQGAGQKCRFPDGLPAPRSASQSRCRADAAENSQTRRSVEAA